MRPVFLQHDPGSRPGYIGDPWVHRRRAEANVATLVTRFLDDVAGTP